MCSKIKTKSNKPKTNKERRDDLNSLHFANTEEKLVQKDRFSLGASDFF